jgi:hypothetical protein
VRLFFNIETWSYFYRGHIQRLPFRKRTTSTEHAARAATGCRHTSHQKTINILESPHVLAPQSNQNTACQRLVLQSRLFNVSSYFTSQQSLGVTGSILRDIAACSDQLRRSFIYTLKSWRAGQSARPKSLPCPSVRVSRSRDSRNAAPPPSSSLSAKRSACFALCADYQLT